MAEEKKGVSGVDVDKLEIDFRADPTNFVTLARAYLERSLADQAVEVCKKGLKVNPSVKNGWLALGMAYYHAYNDAQAEHIMKRVLSQDPQAAAAHRTLGEIWLERGQEQKALTELNRALEIEPGDRHTRALIGSMGEKIPQLRSANGQPEVVWLPRQISNTKVAGKPFWHTLAQLLVLVGVVVVFLVWYQHRVNVQVEVREEIKKAAAVTPRDNFDDLLNAEKSLEAARTLDDSDEKVLARLAFVQSLLWRDHSQQDRKAKLAQYRDWMERKELPIPERYALKGLLLTDEGKVDEAERYLTDIIDRARNAEDIFLNAMIFGVRGENYLKAGKTNEAREDFSIAVKFTGDSPHYQAVFADAYMREGQLSRASKYFRDALRQNPAHVFSNLRLAYSLIQQGIGQDEIQKILSEYLDGSKHPAEEFSPPQKGLLYLVRGEFSLATGDLPGAKEWLKKSLEANDASAEAHDFAGRIATLDKDIQKVNVEYAKALQLDSRLPKIYFNRSESLFQLDQKAAALDKLKEFEKVIKPNVPYHVKAGELYMRLDDLQSAMNEFQKAVKVDELSPDARYYVALTFQKMGEKLGADKTRAEEKRNLYNQARQWYEDTVMLPGGERANVYRSLGLMYLDAEEPDSALDKLAKAAMMMQKGGASSAEVAVVFEDIARVFKFMGGTEGEAQEKAYRAKAQGLREGKPIEQVEKEWAEKEKQGKPKGKKNK